jgi:hypothetical protein
LQKVYSNNISLSDFILKSFLTGQEIIDFLYAFRYREFQDNLLRKVITLDELARRVQAEGENAKTWAEYVDSLSEIKNYLFKEVFGYSAAKVKCLDHDLVHNAITANKLAKENVCEIAPRLVEILYEEKLNNWLNYKFNYGENLWSLKDLFKLTRRQCLNLYYLEEVADCSLVDRFTKQDIQEKYQGWLKNNTKEEKYQELLGKAFVKDLQNFQKALQWPPAFGELVLG